MKKSFLSLLLAVFSVAMAFGQTVTVKGRVVDKNTSLPIAGVTIYPSMVQQPFQTLANGGFLFEISKGEQSFVFNKEGYSPAEIKITVFDSMDLGDVVLTPLQQSVVVSDLPVIELSETELTEGAQSQDISGLLQSSNDVFVSTAGYVFGPARFRMRGYDSENTKVSINGANMNDVESGRAYWSAWGGLNDATREKEVTSDMSAVDYTVGSIGGETNINTYASQYSRGIKASYSVANRSYNNRIQVTGATGLMDNGWAFAVSGSRRWAQEGYVDGTFYDAWAYFATAEKRLNSKHTLNITAFGAPNRRGKSGATTQEMYDLAGTSYYNPYWGFQNGEKRNSRVANYHRPVIILNHKYKINEKLDLNTNVLYTFGKGGSGTALDWNGPADPRPDYYRNLPSYFLGDVLYDQILDAYTNDETTRQLNFDKMYRANHINGESVYIIEDRRTDISQIQASTVASYIVNESLKVNVGGSYQMYKSDNYKIVEDLLGGDFYLDIDKFADRDYTISTGIPKEIFIQNDINNPNRHVVEGDEFGYKYDININTGNAWAQGQYSIYNTDITVGGSFNTSTIWRTGHMQNGKFADNSLGDSEKKTFNNFSTKVAVMHKISGRHYVSANAMYLTQAPSVRNSFMSPRTRNSFLPGLESQTIYSGELSYNYRSPFIKGRFSAYYTEFKDQIKLMSFYNDSEHTFGNYVMTGIDTRHMGLEAGVEVKVTPEIKVNAVAAIGDYTYRSNPKASVYQDNNAKALFQDREVNFKDRFVDGTPQQAYSIGVKYDSPKYWWIGVNGNMFRNIYLSMNPERRTEFAVIGVNPDTDSEKYNSIVDQEKLDNNFTIDLFAGKSWRVNNVSIYLSATVSNILNNQDFITGGYEQLRFDYTNHDVSKYGNKYYYMPGTQFFINLGVRL